MADILFELAKVLSLNFYLFRVEIEEDLFVFHPDIAQDNIVLRLFLRSEAWTVSRSILTCALVDHVLAWLELHLLRV